MQRGGRIALQTRQRIVIDAERGEYAEAATQRDDRSQDCRDHQTDVRKHSTSQPNTRNASIPDLELTRHNAAWLVARADERDTS